MHSKQPIISFCLVGRNDNYTPDFLYRMSTTINFLGDVAQKIGRLEDVEIVVTDWGSDEPLANVLSLTEDGAKIARFIYVPEEITQRYPKGAFPGNTGFNVALRRARGKLAALLGAEVLIPEHSLETLCRQVEHPDYRQRLIICGRYRLPAPWVMSQPNVQEWREYLTSNSWQIAKEPGRGTFLTGNAGLFVYSRELLHESTGVLEELDPLWGWSDVEYTMRILSRYHVVDLHSDGVTVFDMEHFSFAGTRNNTIKKTAPRLLAQQFNANGNSWGGGPIELPFTKAKASTTVEEVIVAPRGYGEHLSSIAAPRFQTFFTWLCDYVGESLTKEETQYLIYLFNIVKSKNVLRYKEFGCTKGFSYYLMHFLFEHLNSVGVDNWLSGGGEWGPDHIVYNLTTPIMAHKGQAALVNHNLTSDSRLASPLKDRDGLVVYRTESNIEWGNIKQEVCEEIIKHDLVLIGNESLSVANMLEKQFPSIHSTTIGNFCYLTLDPLSSVNLDSNLDIASLMHKLAHNSSNWEEHSSVRLMEEVIKLGAQEVVLWCTGYAQLALLWPHLKANVVGVFSDSEETLPEQFKAKRIAYEQIIEFSNAKVIRLK